MKLYYWDEDPPAVDKDDKMHAQAVDLEIVPSGCLLGGSVLIQASQIGKDPCSTCECPRDKCGGRPKTEAEDLAIVSANKSKGITKDALRLRRAAQIKTIYEDANEWTRYRRRGK